MINIDESCYMFTNQWEWHCTIKPTLSNTVRAILSNFLEPFYQICRDFTETFFFFIKHRINELIFLNNASSLGYFSQKQFSNKNMLLNLLEGIQCHQTDMDKLSRTCESERKMRWLITLLIKLLQKIPISRTDRLKLVAVQWTRRGKCW